MDELIRQIIGAETPIDEKSTTWTKENVLGSGIDRLTKMGSWSTKTFSKNKNIGWRRLLEIIRISREHGLEPKVVRFSAFPGEVVVSLPNDLAKDLGEDIFVVLKER
jgi:hypothetical protein